MILFSILIALVFVSVWALLFQGMEAIQPERMPSAEKTHRIFLFVPTVLCVIIAVWGMLYQGIAMTSH